MPCYIGERQLGAQASHSQMMSVRIHSSIDPLTYWRLTARTVTTTPLSQQQAAALLGYTQAPWDNIVYEEAQPASTSKQWADLTVQEKSAATVLGYTESTWSTFAEARKTPWSHLSVTTGENMCSLDNLA